MKERIKKMRVAFCSNYLTHHQIPFCNAMYRTLGEDFKFISTVVMDEERKNGGWDLSEQYSYEIKSYTDDYQYRKAIDIINESDIVIFGTDNFELIKERINKNKIVCIFSERIYKRGRWRVISPRGIYNMVSKHTVNRNKNVYVLCSSGYTAGDFSLLGAYKNKCFKWGYFPEHKVYNNIDELIKNKRVEKIEILWCARFLEWKHPELAVGTLKRLVEDGENVHLTMIGNGKLLPDIKTTVLKNGLGEVVTFIDCLTPDQVREYMEASNIFLFTSDFNEGWGAVLNEAMNSGCAVVASHAIGAVPYLIDDGVNGLIFRNKDVCDLCNKVKKLVCDDDFREFLGKNAYKTIINEWNSDIAAKRALVLFEAMLNGKNLDIYNSGICSRDKFLSNYWYKEK